MRNLLTTVPTCFREVWVMDTEYHAPAGHRPEPICLVAHELRRGTVLRIGRDELLRLREPPFSVGDNALFVAHYASAEFGVFLRLGWPLPLYVFDTFAEHRVIVNGRTRDGKPMASNLLDACAGLGIATIDAVEKESMRGLAKRGGPWSSDEVAALIDYCASDVRATSDLFMRLAPMVSWPHAILRGRAMKAAARTGHQGTPIDVPTYDRLITNWDDIKLQIAARAAEHFDVYDSNGSFSARRFENWLAKTDIAWPRTPTGRLELQDDTFRMMGKVDPRIALLHEVRHTLSKLRLADLAIGPDGRNRAFLSLFRAKTGRNAPSTTEFVFGPAVWIRSLIKPEPGRVLAYLDYSQQEFGIGAAYSGDAAMLHAYECGDPYMAFAIQAGAAPPDATKKSHRAVRELFKQCILALQYCMGAKALGERINRPEREARELIALHRETYSTFWRWSDMKVDDALLSNRIQTVLGWQHHIVGEPNARSLSNWPMQSAGSEMLRLAWAFAWERGVAVCAPVHDALLIETTVDTMDRDIATALGAMSDASAIVLGGYRLRADASPEHVVTHPERFVDERGAQMWQLVMNALDRFGEGGVT